MVPVYQVAVSPAGFEDRHPEGLEGVSQRGVDRLGREDHLRPADRGAFGGVARERRGGRKPSSGWLRYMSTRVCASLKRGVGDGEGSSRWSAWW